MEFLPKKKRKMYDNLCKYALYSRKMYVVYYVYVSPYSCISIHFSPVHMKLKMLQNIIPTYIRQRAQKDHCRTYSFHIPVNIEYFVQHCLTSLFSGLSAASKKWSLFTLRPKRVPGGWVHKKSFANPNMAEFPNCGQIWIRIWIQWIPKKNLPELKVKGRVFRENV